MSILSSNPQLGSFITLSTKRDALWNVVEPGDPYDIRKSMIAKVPGDKKNFMGDYLQIVCLFQAAEIERLCQFLDDFKLKYREVERRELDRHSYEIQIKELNHKLSQESFFREQNEKLKDFIKNINSNKQEQDDSIRMKYQRLLLQFKVTQDQNSRLRQDNQNLMSQISTFEAKFEALRKSKQTEIQEIYSRISQQSNMPSQFELNSLKSQYESQIQRIGLQNQRLRQSQEENLRQLTIWQEKYRTLEQQMFTHQPSENVLNHQRQIAEYENRFIIFGKEIDRLNLVVRNITAKFESSEQKNRDYENKLQIANRELSLLQNKSLSGLEQSQDLLRKISELQMENKRLQQSKIYIEENQSKLRFANEEIIRLNNQVKLQVQNSNRIKSELSRLQYEGSKVSILEKQLYESKQRASQNDTLKMQLAQKENKIAILRQQIERINGQLSKKGGLDSNYQSLLNEYQKLQRGAEELEKRNQMTVQQYESRITQKISEYESRIELINRTKGSEFESKASLLQGQVQRLGDLIQKRNEEIENLQRQIREMKMGQSQAEFEVNRKIQNYESIIQGMKRESQQMIKRMRDSEGFQRKISEYENKNTIISQQIERLNYQLRNKDMDIENLKIKLKDQQIAIIQKYEMDTNRKLGTYQLNFNNLVRENEQLKRKYADMEKTIALLSQQIQRLTTKLRQAQTVNSRYEQEVQQLQKNMRDTEVTLKSKYQTQMSQKESTYQMTIRTLQGQTDEEIRKKLLQLQNSNRKNAEYERAMDQVSRQLQRLGNALRQKNEENIQLDNKNKGLIRELQDLGRKYVELQNMVKSKYEVEALARITNLEQNLSALNRENQELKRYLQEYQNKFKDQNGAIQQINSTLRNLSQENENLKRQIQDTQFSYRNKLEVDVSNQYKMYEKTILDMKKDLQNLLRVKDDIERSFRQYEAETSQKIALLAQQNERILNHLQNKTEELKKSQQQGKQLTNKLQNLERSMNQSQSSVQQYEMQVNTRITQYEQSLALLTQQNADLQNKLKIINELNYKIAEYQSKIVIINQELERVNINLRRQVQKSSQLENSLRNVTAQNNQLTKNIAELKSSISEKYEVEATRTIRALQQNLEILEKENQQIKAILSKYEQELNNRGSEIQNLTMNLNSTIEQNKYLKNQIKETQIFLTQRYESEVKSRYSAYEKDITNYQKQIDDLMKKLIEYSERVVPQYEKQIVTLRQEIQKMNHRFNQDNNQLVSNLNALGQQNDALKRQIGQLQISIQKYESQTKQKISSYEQNVVLLQRENEELKRYLQQFGGQYEGLGQSHKNLQRQIQEYHMKVQSEQKKSELLEKDLNNLGRENNELKGRLGEMQQQIERLIGKLNQLSKENERIKRQGRQNEAQLANRLQMEAVQQINIHKQQLAQMDSNLKASQREIQLLQKRLSQLGQDANRKIAAYDDEIKRLTSEIQKRSISIQDYDSKLRSIFNENQQLKKHLHQTQINFNKTFESEIKTRTFNYEQSLENITKNAQKREKEILENSNQRIMDLENKAVLLSQELERLNQVLKAKHQENQMMNQQIERLTNTLRLQIQQSKKLEAQHHTLRSNTQSEFTQLQTSYNLILKDNDNYKKNLFEYENSIKKLYTEFERLQKIINDYKVERQSLYQKNYGLSNEIQRLNAQIQRLQIEVEEVRLRLSDQAALNKRINEHMALFVVLFAEIESLRKRVKDKEKEVQDVRRSSLAPFKLQSRQL